MAKGEQRRSKHGNQHLRGSRLGSGAEVRGHADSSPPFAAQIQAAGGQREIACSSFEQQRAPCQLAAGLRPTCPESRLRPRCRRPPRLTWRRGRHARRRHRRLPRAASWRTAPSGRRRLPPPRQRPPRRPPPWPCQKAPRDHRPLRLPRPPPPPQQQQQLLSCQKGRPGRPRQQRQQRRASWPCLRQKARRGQRPRHPPRRCLRAPPPPRQREPRHHRLRQEASLPPRQIGPSELRRRRRRRPPRPFEQRRRPPPAPLYRSADAACRAAFSSRGSGGFAAEPAAAPAAAREPDAAGGAAEPTSELSSATEPCEAESPPR